ncbi:MAG: M20/M25/M40 family metallo-hydrolase, partial [Flavitalea sp.]
TDYFPFPFSANKRIEAAVAVALAEKGVPWFTDLKDILEETSGNPHADLLETIQQKAKKVAAKGATALFIYNNTENKDLAFDGKTKTEMAPIPVLYVARAARKKYLGDESAMLDIKLKVDIGDKKRTGNNIAGYLDNGAGHTIIIGAHYDHIGFGEDGEALSPAFINQVHNGADDNASGTAALIELARLLKQSKKKTSNYLFIAFSGEEAGLYGSKYFTEHPSIDLKQVSYMINMDMVGRLNDSARSLTVGGYGTSPSWGQTLGSLSSAKYFSLKYDSSGTGPSDHTSFYRKNIPVLFFFTGLHPDYHKPSDDIDKINYTGEMYIVKYILDIIDKTSPISKLAFQQTRERQISGSARFTVTLGILPDYTFNGTGIRVDGVSAGRPAEKAGLQAADIIVQLADYSTSSLEQYMQALSTFKKGDKTKVLFKRGKELKQAEVEF